MAAQGGIDLPQCCRYSDSQTNMQLLKPKTEKTNRDRLIYRISESDRSLSTRLLGTEQARSAFREKEIAKKKFRNELTKKNSRKRNRQKGIVRKVTIVQNADLSFGAWISTAPSPTQVISKQDRRRFLNDALLFLQVGAVGTVLLSRNFHDLDLLLQMRPQPFVLLYEKS